MSTHAARVFSVLVGLDPLAPSSDPASRPALEAAPEHEATVAAHIAHILAQPQHGPTVAATVHGARRDDRRASHVRSGVLGLVMSAAIAVAAMILWASPSGGQPAQRSMQTPVHVALARGAMAVRSTGTRHHA